MSFLSKIATHLDKAGEQDHARVSVRVRRKTHMFSERSMVISAPGQGHGRLFFVDLSIFSRTKFEIYEADAGKYALRSECVPGHDIALFDNKESAQQLLREIENAIFPRSKRWWWFAAIAFLVIVFVSWPAPSSPPATAAATGAPLAGLQDSRQSSNQPTIPTVAPQIVRPQAAVVASGAPTEPAPVPMAPSTDINDPFGLRVVPKQ